MVLFCFLFSLTSHILDGWPQPQFAEQLLSYLSVLPPNPPSLLLLALHTSPTLLYSALLHRMALLARVLPHLCTLQSKTVHSVHCTYIYQQCWFSTALKCVTWTGFHMLLRITEINLVINIFWWIRQNVPESWNLMSDMLYNNESVASNSIATDREERSVQSREPRALERDPAPPLYLLLLLLHPDAILSLRWALFFLARW